MERFALADRERTSADCRLETEGRTRALRGGRRSRSGRRGGTTERPGTRETPARRAQRICEGLERHGELDAAGRTSPSGVRLPRTLFALVLLPGLVCRIEGADEEQRLQSVRKLYEQEEWEKVLREARGPADQSADFDYYAGMALSRLERWTEAREAFSIAARKTPRDARFLVERAGAEYKLGTFGAAKRDLRRSLRLNPDDPYAAEFLGTIYLLEGNLEASLKYWNMVGKPRLEAV